MEQPDWRPALGQVALIEPVGEESCLTGVVTDVEGDRVVINLGGSPRPQTPTAEVVASFFRPEALYRLTGKARVTDDAGGVLELSAANIERVQRRAAQRLQISLPVSLTALDGPGPFVSVAGTTVDLGTGGCRVVTDKPFPPGPDPTVAIQMPDSAAPLVALAHVLEVRATGARIEYRLVFASIAESDIERIERLSRDS